jgi:hypothetical protein
MKTLPVPRPGNHIAGTMAVRAWFEFAAELFEEFHKKI